MNLLYGQLMEVTNENGMRIGRVRVSGASRKVPLELLTAAAPGDKVLLCDGVAIAKVREEPQVGSDSEARS